MIISLFISITLTIYWIIKCIKLEQFIDYIRNKEISYFDSAIIIITLIWTFLNLFTKYGMIILFIGIVMYILEQTTIKTRPKYRVIILLIIIINLIIIVNGITSIS